MKYTLLVMLTMFLPKAFAEGQTNWQEERRVKGNPPAVSAPAAPIYTNWQNERRVKPKPVQKRPVDSGTTSYNPNAFGRGNEGAVENSAVVNETQNVIVKEIDPDQAVTHDGSAPDGIPGAASAFEGSAGAR